MADIFLNPDSNPKVILCTPVPIFPEFFYKLSSKIMADEVVPVDVFRKFSDINDLSLFDKDKLHLNNKGHKVVAGIFDEVFADNLRPEI